MKIHDQSILTIYEALHWLQLFFVGSAIIEYNIHSVGHDVVVVVRAQNPMMQKKRPPVC